MDGRSKYNPRLHHRKSIRLQGYDYSREGLYFITICTRGRLCLFGDIIGEKMVFNEAGSFTDQCWLQIPEHFPQVILHDHVVMPNHVHAIIELKPGPSFTGFRQNQFQHLIPGSIGSIVKGFKIGVTKWFRYGPPDPNVVVVGAENFQTLQQQQPLQQQHDHNNEAPLPSIWQRNFHDHIIRNEEEYYRIKNYIRNNPKNWNKDKFYRGKK